MKLERIDDITLKMDREAIELLKCACWSIRNSLQERLRYDTEVQEEIDKYDKIIGILE